jgi:cell division septation protein DedD
LGFNIFAERTPVITPDTSPWLARSTFRVTRSFPTGAVRLPGVIAGGTETRSRGTGSVVGSVFADWDADGVPAPDEGPLEGIPVLLGKTAATKTSAQGDFAFTNVPSGRQQVRIDLSALPVDFDAPAAPTLEMDVTRNETRRVAFGLVPLGTVTGRILRDANGNSIIDPGDEPIDGAVLVLDAGQRSEQTRKGRYQFDAVRSGRHTLELLLDSLPEGAAVTGERAVDVGVTRQQQSSTVDFLVKLEKRPEIRKVFPPKGGVGAGSAPPATGVPGATTPTPTHFPARRGSSSSGAIKSVPTPDAAASSAAPRRRTFTIQVAALSELSSARALVAELKQAGYVAYVVVPSPAETEGLYRVRVGHYTTRALATRTVTRLERLRGEKLWVTREQ